MNRDARVCVGVARILSVRRGGDLVRIVDLPDERERQHRAIELIAADEYGEMALEHTQIESFGGQVASGIAAEKLAELLRHAVRDLPSGRFQLVLDPTALPTGTEIEGAARGLAVSIADMGSTLKLGGPGVRGQHMAELPKDLGVVARLHRWPGPDPGVLEYLFAPPHELEQLRFERAVKAVDDKVPKLLDAAGHDRVSVLVLEDRDIALSNRPLLARAVSAALETNGKPDVVFLVEVWDESAEGCLLKEVDAWFPDIDQAWWELNLTEPEAGNGMEG